MSTPDDKGKLLERFAGSFRYERDPEFRSLMSVAVTRGVGVLGSVGLTILGLYLFAEIVLLGKTPVWNYAVLPSTEAVVLWDKVAILIICLACLYLWIVKKPQNPRPGRTLAFAGAALMTVAMVLDDVGAGSVSFSSAYVALVVLVTTAVVPFRPLSAGLLALTVMLLWYASVEIIPGSIGLTPLEVSGDQAIFLGILVIFVTVIARTLYESRFLQFSSLRRSQTLVAQLESAMLTLTQTQTRLIHSEKMASLGRFVSGVAHELRNPLNFVSNFSRISQELADEFRVGGQGSDEVVGDLKANLAMIQKHAERANNIVTELISHSDDTSTEPKTADINQLVATQVRVVTTNWSKAGRVTNVHEDYDPGVGDVEVLQARFSRAIRGVLDNAFVATDDLDDREAEIRVSTTRLDDMVRIVIEDNGTGFDEDIAEHVFEPFFTRWNAGTHTGLGLAIAYEVITDGHGGSIDISTEKGSGTTVTIRIPCG